MIVDDAEFNLSIIEKYMVPYGVRVINQAFNGQEAVNFFKMATEKNLSIDIITMDLEMPVLNGKQALI